MPRYSRYRLKSDQTLELNLTPLLDVVLQLITFFMMLVHFGTKLEGATKTARLPIAAAGTPKSDLGLDRLVVVIDARGGIVSGDQSLSDRASEAWWNERAEKRRRGAELIGASSRDLATRVIVRADRDAPYGEVRRRLAEARRAGFAKFTLVVLRSRK
jgi:biopolymer transport protein ExbD